MTEWCVFWESEVVEDVVQQDIKEQKELEEQRRMEQMPKEAFETVGMGNQKSQMKTNNVRKIKQKQRIGDLDYEKTNL